MHKYLQLQLHVKYSISYISYLSDGKNMHWSHSKRQQVYYISTKSFRLQININKFIHFRHCTKWNNSIADMANRYTF